ncbi:MAG: hypothetical protein AB7N29_08585 [Vicinamibacterales bacterium]
MGRYAVFICSLLVAAATAALPAQDADTALTGRWRGRAVVENAEMGLDVEIKAAGGKAEGTVTTAHGALTITGGTFAQGKWTLPFSGPGVEGRMVGIVKGDRFTGDWLNPALGPGFFELARVK